MEYILPFSEPARSWSEALPLGNGRFGAMVYGLAHGEVIDLSEGTFFSGDGRGEATRPGTPEAVARVRELLARGLYPEAQAEAAAITGQKGNYGTNLPVGRLTMSFLPSEAKVQSYERSLDFRTGVYRCRQTAGDRAYVRTAFAS